MNPTDSDYAAFLDRLPELRRLYDRRLHQFEVTNGPGHGDSLGSVERYFARVGSIREPNRQTLRRLVACVDHVRAGMSREDAVKQARHGTANMYAAFNVATGEVLRRITKRHRATEFRQFLAQIDRATPPELALHLIVDNSSCTPLNPSDGPSRPVLSSMLSKGLARLRQETSRTGH